MKEKKTPYDVYVYVCTGKDCANNKGRDLLKGLKKELKDRNLNKKINVVSTSCIDECKKAPNMLVFPECRLLSRVKDKDVSEIADSLEKALKDSGCNE